MALIGYARVSTEEQNLDLQLHALQKSGCTIIFKDYGVSATAQHKPEFERALETLKAGDILVLWKMDRAFRSVKSALDVLEILNTRRIKLRCLTEEIDTGNAMGMCTYIIRNTFAQLERDLNSERTTAGMSIAKTKGIHVGRPRKLRPAMLMLIRYLLRWRPHLTHRRMAAYFGISTRTLSRQLNARPVQDGAR